MIIERKLKAKTHCPKVFKGNLNPYCDLGITSDKWCTYLNWSKLQQLVKRCFLFSDSGKLKAEMNANLSLKIPGICNFEDFCFAGKLAHFYTFSNYNVCICTISDPFKFIENMSSKNSFRSRNSKMNWSLTIPMLDMTHDPSIVDHWNTYIIRT